MADESTCPDCLPWCTRHIAGPVGLHRSAGEHLPLRDRRGDRGDASACAIQLADDPDSAVVVSVKAGSLLAGGAARMEAHNAEFAEALARFIERLDAATPAQHRTLAAQIRAAAAVAFGEREAGNASVTRKSSSARQRTAIMFELTCGSCRNGGVPDGNR